MPLGPRHNSRVAMQDQDGARHDIEYQHEYYAVLTRIAARMSSVMLGSGYYIESIEAHYGEYGRDIQSHRGGQGEAELFVRL